MIPVVSAVEVSGFPHLTTEFDGVTKRTRKLAEQQMFNRRAGDLCIDLVLLFPGALALHTEKYSCQRRALEGCDQVSVRCISAARSSNRKIKVPMFLCDLVGQLGPKSDTSVIQ